MTTAARPTWDTARGGRGKGEGDLSALSKQYSSRDLPAHTKLKYRYCINVYNLQQVSSMYQACMYIKLITQTIHGAHSYYSSQSYSHTLNDTDSDTM